MFRNDRSGAAGGRAPSGPRDGDGGLIILAIYLQQHWGVSAGYFQLVVNLAILAMAFVVLTPSQTLLSVLGTVVINMVVAISHKPDRYLGVS